MTNEIQSSPVEQLEREHSYRELERKFVPIDPQIFAQFRRDTDPIVQLYLNERCENYGLRFRQQIIQDDVVYTATIKDGGVLDAAGLNRLEVASPITAETFNQAFNDAHNPRLFKDRATPCSGVSIDWIKGYSTPIIEIENADIDEAASAFLSRYQDYMIELTGNPKVDNEWIARQLSNVVEREAIEGPITAADILRDVAAYKRSGYEKLVIGIAGRSGSGKSTLAREVADKLYVQQGITARLMETDWYHRGLTWLTDYYGAPWSNWELPIVYDTASMAGDIKRLQAGEAVAKRRFDFPTQEPVKEGVLQPADVIIIEGIQAGSPDLNGVRQMFYEVVTPLTTCLGRDVERILATSRPNSSIASPEERLRYILETGEPTYQDIRATHPRRNVFSASVRSIGKTGLSLV